MKQTINKIFIVLLFVFGAILIPASVVKADAILYRDNLITVNIYKNNAGGPTAIGSGLETWDKIMAISQVVNVDSYTGHGIQLHSHYSENPLDFSVSDGSWQPSEYFNRPPCEVGSSLDCLGNPYFYVYPEHYLFPTQEGTIHGSDAFYVPTVGGNYNFTNSFQYCNDYDVDYSCNPYWDDSYGQDNFTYFNIPFTVFSPPPPPPPPPAVTVTVTADPLILPFPGGPSRISWTSTGATSCLESGNRGGYGTTGFFDETITSSSTFSVNCWSMPTIKQISSSTVNYMTTQIFVVGSNIVAGDKFSLTAYGHEILVTAVYGDTYLSILNKLKDAINNTTEKEWYSGRDVGVVRPKPYSSLIRLAPSGYGIQTVVKSPYPFSALATPAP